MRSTYQPEWSVKKNFNSETALWWDSAQLMYDINPELCPDSVAPLFEKSLNEEEILISRNDLKEVQAWAIGLIGWRDIPSCPLIFEKK